MKPTHLIPSLLDPSLTPTTNTPARVSDWLRQETQERHLLSRRGVGDFLLNGGCGSRCVGLENIISKLCHMG
ncbi:hypothetical protein NPIL_25991 [Nephila pilipes]|uniref:Uncharacterized protein n=1 Tax=Nephila pilipes TaxID=299642 RepID=A0A8X6I2J2_NEPPI|nr:hypothetical protein NPIL_25991 [Nephila pilipes]